MIFPIKYDHFVGGSCSLLEMIIFRGFTVHFPTPSHPPSHADAGSCGLLVGSRPKERRLTSEHDTSHGTQTPEIAGIGVGPLDLEEI